MIQQPTALAPAGFPSTLYQSPDKGSGVTAAAVVVSFLNSLHPGYAAGPSSTQVEYPTFCTGSSDQQGHSLLQRTELAARVVSACVGLPSEVISFVGGLANFSAAARWLDGKRAELMSGESMINRDEDHSAARKKQQCGTTCHQVAQVPKVAVALGTVSCLGVVGADGVEKQWNMVNDVSVLNKIGRDPAHPLDGRYRQTAAINAYELTDSIGNKSHPFVGEYDGCGHTISNLKHCFMKKLDRNGRLFNQIFAGAEINSGEQAGVVACHVSGKAVLDNILVENSTVSTTSHNAPAGLAAAVADNETEINDFEANLSTVKTWQRDSDAGVVVGVAHGTVNNTRSTDCKVETFHELSDAGGVAGKAYGVINNAVVLCDKVSTHGYRANAGGGAAHAVAGAVINNTTLISCELVTHDDQAHVGGGAGVVDQGATVANTLLVRTNLETHGEDADAGGAAGSVLGDVVNTTMVEGEVATQRTGAQAAVGGGEVFSSGRVDQTTSRRAVIKTTGINAEGGVGAGRAGGTVTRTVCFNSDVLTSNNDADAGLGAGWVTGSVDEVVARGCTVITSGHGADAGFGVGDFGVGAFGKKGTARQLTILSSSVEASGSQTSVGINGRTVFICGSSVNEYKSLPCCDEYTFDSCLPIPNAPCSHADQRVLDRECQPTEPPFIDVEKNRSFVCAAIPKPTTGTLMSTPFSITASPLMSATATDMSATSIGLGATTISGKLPTAARVNATVVPPMPLAPAAALGTGSIVGIALGATAGVCLLGAAAFVLYCRYRNCERPPALLPVADFEEL